MSLSVVLTSDAGNDASAVAARTAILAHHTMRTDTEMLQAPLSSPCDQCKF